MFSNFVFFSFFFLQKTYFSLNKTVLNIWSGKTCKILEKQQELRVIPEILGVSRNPLIRQGLCEIPNCPRDYMKSLITRIPCNIYTNGAFPFIWRIFTKWYTNLAFWYLFTNVSTVMSR